MDLSPAAAYVLDTLEDSGYGAWLVGGCVRDSLRGVMPRDFDIATTAMPQQVMSCFPDFYVIPTGMRHGTVTVVADGGMLEITTLRADGSYGDGRRPDAVTFVTDINIDLSRRDFTVNAMAWNAADGLIDPFGGQTDLARRKLRCVGNPVVRLHEDGLRIMRALRFAACLGFDIVEDTAAALHSESGGLEHVAAERLSHELSLLVCGEYASGVISEYHDILSVIIPDIIPNISQKLLIAAGNDPAVRLALLLDGTKPQKALERLRFDSDTVKRTMRLCELMRQPLPCNRMEAAIMVETAGSRAAENLRHIRWAQASEASPDEAEKLLAAEEYLGQVLHCGCTSTEQLKINGNTLIDMGMTSGKELGNILNALTHAVMAGSCPNEPRALSELARQLYRGAKM